MLKTLVLDIETSPMEAFVWNRKDVQIALNQIKEEWSVMSWGAKWWGDHPSKVMYQSTSKEKNPRDDRKILRALRDLIDQADILVTQNGEQFDARKLNARFILLGIRPPSPYRHFDTYKLIHRVAAMTSSSLEYLTGKLNTKYKKLAHKKYPGMELWKECLKGNQDAWKEMKKYNIHDVLSTEELAGGLIPWAPESFPKFWADEGIQNDRLCKNCGQAKLQNNGYRFSNDKRYHRKYCYGCGSWSKGGLAK
jgi:DNA polymerase elongation subunit (family B)